MRIKRGGGSHLFVVDNSDLTDFIRHHAWFEGDEVALPREDRLYCWDISQVGHPEDAGMQNVVVSFPVKTEQYELEPEGTGANELEPDEMAVDDEDGTASTPKPLAANQKKVIQNIHNNFGHLSRKEFLRAHRLTCARPEVLS